MPASAGRWRRLERCHYSVHSLKQILTVGCLSKHSVSFLNAHLIAVLHSFLLESGSKVYQFLPGFDWYNPAQSTTANIC